MHAPSLDNAFPYQQSETSEGGKFGMDKQSISLGSPGGVV
jgi:hypothetical protein